ncbi:hypothetical protein Tco_0845922, partial [Tanacetum coccineum]
MAEMMCLSSTKGSKGQKSVLGLPTLITNTTQDKRMPLGFYKREENKPTPHIP